MKWDIKLDKTLIQESFLFISDFLKDYDVKPLKWIKISPGADKYEGVYGLCMMPGYRNADYYRISCSLPGPFPSARISQGKGYVYKKYNKWPKYNKKPISKGIRVIKGKKKYWRRYAEPTMMNSYDEALVWIFGHEIFHYLRATKQIPGRNVETQADAFGDKLLNIFKEQKALQKNI